jgi:endonuclease-3
LVLSQGFNTPAICVDVHVHRIFNRLGYLKTKDPEETEFALRKKLPKKYWIPINTLLVTHGQNVCKPINPKCDICPVEQYCKKIIKK